MILPVLGSDAPEEEEEGDMIQDSKLKKISQYMFYEKKEVVEQRNLLRHQIAKWRKEYRGAQAR